jgi:hypothetical protein
MDRYVPAQWCESTDQKPDTPYEGGYYEVVRPFLFGRVTRILTDAGYRRAGDIPISASQDEVHNVSLLYDPSIITDGYRKVYRECWELEMEEC